MGAHEAFLASGNRATRQPAPGKVRAGRRRNRRVVSTLTARQLKSWHFYGFGIAGPDRRQGGSGPPSLSYREAGGVDGKTLVAQRGDPPAVGNHYRSRRFLSVVASGSNATAVTPAYSPISG